MGKCLDPVSTPMTWYEAEQECRGRNGQLLILENSDVHAAVVAELDVDLKPFWIGARRAVWRWSGKRRNIN